MTAYGPTIRIPTRTPEIDTDPMLTPQMVDLYECTVYCDEILAVVEVGCADNADVNNQINLGASTTPGGGYWIGNCDPVSGICTFELEPGVTVRCDYEACEVQDVVDTDDTDGGNQTPNMGGQATCETVADQKDGTIWPDCLAHPNLNLDEDFEEMVSRILTACGISADDVELMAEECTVTSADFIREMQDFEDCSNTASAVSGQEISMQFGIDPSTSEMTITGSSWDGPGYYTVPLNGQLFMAPGTTPTLLAGLASSPSFLWDTEWIDTPWVGFRVPVDMIVNYSTGDIELEASEFSVLWVEGRRRSTGARIAYALTPTEDTLGSINPITGTYELDFSMTWDSGAYEVDVHLEGPLHASDW